MELPHPAGPTLDHELRRPVLRMVDVLRPSKAVNISSMLGHEDEIVEVRFDQLGFVFGPDLCAAEPGERFRCHRRLDVEQSVVVTLLVSVLPSCDSVRPADINDRTAAVLARRHNRLTVGSATGGVNSKAPARRAPVALSPTSASQSGIDAGGTPNFCRTPDSLRR